MTKTETTVAASMDGDVSMMGSPSRLSVGFDADDEMTAILLISTNNVGTSDTS